MVHGSLPKPITEQELELAFKVAKATLPPGTFAKRFIRAITMGWTINLTDERGRPTLAFIAHRFRKQYTLTKDEWEWIRRWRSDLADK